MVCVSELLGVNPLMDWPEIRARYRYLLKRHHPDVGGDPEMTKHLIEEFKRLDQTRNANHSDAK
jgi:curved DNA-binding protein CbpA